MEVELSRTTHKQIPDCQTERAPEQVDRWRRLSFAGRGTRMAFSPLCNTIGQTTPERRRDNSTWSGSDENAPTDVPCDLLLRTDIGSIKRFDEKRF